MTLVSVFGIVSLDSLALVFCRVAAVAFLLPGLSASYVPPRFKLALTFVISITIFSAVTNSTPLPPNSFETLSIIMVKEIIFGTIIGFSIRFGLFTLQIAGTIVAQASSIAQIFGGSVSNDAQSTISNILTISGVTLLMISGFLDTFVLFLVQSYDWLPLNSAIDGALILDMIVNLMVSSYALAFQLALPFLALSLFYNFTLGAINRAMPQLLVSFVGAPAIIAASIALLLIAIEPILSEWRYVAFDSLPMQRYK